MLNIISMEWFQGNSGEQPRKEPRFYHLTTWSSHSFSQKPPLTPNISHIPCPPPTASCWTHLPRGIGTCSRFSLNPEGKGHSLEVCLLWDMPKPPWGITCWESRGCPGDGCLTDTSSTGEAPFSGEHLWPQSYPMSTSTFAELAAWTPPSEGGLSKKAKIQLPRLQSRAVCMSTPIRTAHLPRNALHLPVMGHTNTPHDPFEGGHSTAVPAGFQSQPKAKGRACCSSQKQDLVFFAFKAWPKTLAFMQR